MFSVGGGTVALIQPFGGGDGGGARSAPPAASAPVTPGTGASPSGTGGTPPAPSASTPQSPGAPAPDGQVGGQAGGASNPGGAAAQGGAAGGAVGAGTPGGGGGNPGGAGGAGSDPTKGTGTGSGPAAGGAGGGSTPGGSGTTPGGSGSPSGGGSSGGDAVPAYFVGTWNYKGSFNLGQPDTVTVSRTGAIRMVSNSQMGHCEYMAKVVSVTGGTKMNVSAATEDKSKSNSQFCGTLDPSFFTKSEPMGLQHNVGPSHGEGYYYERS